MSLAVVTNDATTSPIDPIVRDVQSRFRRSEADQDQLIEDGAELLLGIVRATRSLELAPHDAHRAIVETGSLIARQIEGRGQVIELHRLVARIARRNRIEVRAFGCPDDLGDDLLAFPGLNAEHVLAETAAA